MLNTVNSQYGIQIIQFIMCCKQDFYEIDISYLVMTVKLLKREESTHFYKILLKLLYCFDKR